MPSASARTSDWITQRVTDWLPARMFVSRISICVCVYVSVRVCQLWNAKHCAAVARFTRQTIISGSQLTSGFVSTCRACVASTACAVVVARATISCHTPAASGRYYHYYFCCCCCTAVNLQLLRDSTGNELVARHSNASPRHATAQWLKCRCFQFFHFAFHPFFVVVYC